MPVTSETSSMPVSSEVTSDYSGSLTPTSLGEESEEEEDGREKKLSESSSLIWAGVGAKKVAFIMFKQETLVSRDKRLKAIGERYHLAYKMVKTESKLVRSVLTAYGFHEVHPNSPDFNLMWTGAHLKPFSLRSLQDFQKVNHFPRSYEITRKDRLFKNIDRLAHTKGVKHFDFMPKSFLMPSEYQDFCAAYVKDKGPWIVKPIASSRGRGIYLINNPNQVPLEDNIMICKYIANPLLIDGFKFDVRVYIAVTSYDPLMIYLFEEGLTRFATVKYEKTNRHLKNQMMHLTNYSINKKSHDYVRCEDPDVEDYGNKWSMSAMLRYLKQEGIDTTALMMRIEAVIIKAIIAAELPIATACKMFVPYRENCMELYGFDILVDENLKPWLLEGNLSPSLACDAPLDLKIKSCMISDFFSLVGFQCVDPQTRRQKKEQVKGQSKRPASASGSKLPCSSGLSNVEAKVLKMAKEQHQRRGSFIRIFPTPETWELYSSFLEYKSNLNLMLAQKLFPERVRSKPPGAYSTAVARMRGIAAGQVLESRNRVMAERFMQYERKLLSLETLKNKRTRKTSAHRRKKETPVGIDAQPLEAGHMGKREEVDGGSDVADDEEESAVGTDIAESEPAKVDHSKSFSKLQSLQSVASLSSKVSLAKLKKSALARAGAGPGGDLNPVTKSVYASVRSQDSLVATQVSDLVSTSRTSILLNQSSAKPMSKSEKAAADNAAVKLTPPQRVYTYKSIVKQENSGDANAMSGKDAMEKDSNCRRDALSDSDDFATCSSTDSEQYDRHVSGQNQPQENQETLAARQRNNVDVLQALKTGKNLGKVQARRAFSAYLSRVQQRLKAESETLVPQSSETVAKQEDQMDLVLRFLKRAAGNLRHSFAVIVPSKRLGFPDRQRILAKQLADFVHIYHKETETMEQKLDFGSETPITNAWSESVHENTHVEDSDFRLFITAASEAELEEVLTAYTHKNKSASVFLGASRSKAREKKEISSVSTGKTQTTSRLQSRNRLSGDQPVRSLVRAEQMCQSEEHIEDLYELNLHRRSHSARPTLRMRSSSPASSIASLSSRGGTATSHQHCLVPSAHHRPNLGLNSLQQAAYIYSTKLTPPSSVTNFTAAQNRTRKKQATTRDLKVNGQQTAVSSTASGNQLKNRLLSAGTDTVGLGGSLHFQTASNEEAIAEGLQKLAERQAARQYSATSQLQALSQHLSGINFANISAKRQKQQLMQRASSLSDLASSSPTVQSTMDPDLWNADSVNPQSRPSSGSFPSNNAADGEIQSHFLAQQSKELLLQSKAKHQTMVAQAHEKLSEGSAQFELAAPAKYCAARYRDDFDAGGRNLLNTLMLEGEEERGCAESEAGNDSVKGLRMESLSSPRRQDSSDSKIPATNSFHTQLKESYSQWKVLLSEDSDRIRDCEASKVKSNDPQRSGRMTPPVGTKTEKHKSQVVNNSSQTWSERNPLFSVWQPSKPKSKVEQVWISYHETSRSISAKGTKTLEKQNSGEKHSKSVAKAQSVISAPSRSGSSGNCATCGTLTYKKALGWAKNDAGDGRKIQGSIFSDIKGILFSGELPCKRWRYRTSCVRCTKPWKAHNAISTGLDSATNNTPSATNQRPDSVMANSHPQVPRPPEKPKPVEGNASQIRKQLGNVKRSQAGSHPQLTGLGTCSNSLEQENHRANFYSNLKYDASTGTTKIAENIQDLDSARTLGAEVGSRPSNSKRPTWKP